MDDELKESDFSIPTQIAKEYTNVCSISHCSILAARKHGGCLNGIREDTLTIDRLGNLDSRTRFFLAEKNALGKTYMYVIQVVNDGPHGETISVMTSFFKKDHTLLPDV